MCITTVTLKRLQCFFFFCTKLQNFELIKTQLLLQLLVHKCFNELLLSKRNKMIHMKPISFRRIYDLNICHNLDGLITLFKPISDNCLKCIRYHYYIITITFKNTLYLYIVFYIFGDIV